jgi:hypothetical protein
MSDDATRRYREYVTGLFVIACIIWLVSCAQAGARPHNVSVHPRRVTRWTPEIERIFTAHDITLGYTARTLRCIHRESHGGTWANPRRTYWGLLQIDKGWSFPLDRDGSGREACTVAPWQACGSCSIHAMAHKIRTEGVRRTQGRWRTWR